MGSVLSPREIMIPNGSVKPISLRSFFILALTFGLPHLWPKRIKGTRRAMLDVARK